MTNTKHTPATPLPWRALKRAGQFDVLHAEEGRVTSLHYAHGVKAQHDCQRQDSDYIAHAANAYPRLVELAHEAIREARIVWQESNALRDSQAAGALARKWEALLAELGE